MFIEMKHPTKNATQNGSNILRKWIFHNHEFPLGLYLLQQLY